MKRILLITIASLLTFTVLAELTPRERAKVRDWPKLRHDPPGTVLRKLKHRDVVVRGTQTNTVERFAGKYENDLRDLLVPRYFTMVELRAVTHSNRQEQNRLRARYIQQEMRIKADAVTGNARIRIMLDTQGAMEAYGNMMEAGSEGLSDRRWLDTTITSTNRVATTNRVSLLETWGIDHTDIPTERAFRNDVLKD